MQRIFVAAQVLRLLKDRLLHHVVHAVCIILDLT